MVVSVLMVAEKPSIAQTLAAALCTRGSPNLRPGQMKVWEYSGDFYGQPAWFKVTSCAGHIYTIDFPPEFNNWDRTDPSQLFSAKTVKIEARKEARIPAFFQREAKGCSYLVLWLDCDREGENICFEVMENVEPNLVKLPGTQQVWRAHFSSLAPVDLQKAMQTLGSPNENESKSVDARQEMDLKLGCAFTRFQTKYFQGKYGDLDSRLISYGPCQTPTLWFCVRRHDEITSFQPESYYKVDVVVSKGAQDLYLEWGRGQVFDMSVAHTFKGIVAEGMEGGAQVQDVIEKEDRMPRPQALNTVAMLKMASSKLGIGPQQAMHEAENLYLRGLITYPRTETNSYPKNFDLHGTVRAQANHPGWGQYVQELLRAGLNKARDGVDAGDHPPITPVRAATEGEVGEGGRLYDMITRHFLATVSADCKFMRTKVKMLINGEEFWLSGRKVIDPGFTRIQKPSGEGMEDVAIPSFKRGDSVAVKSVKVSDHQTQAPPNLSESDLLGLMEKHGIGTDASMATHINNIQDRNYVTLHSSSRRLEPTKLGIALVHGYQMVDNELVIPRVRSDMERNCTLVAKGEADCQALVLHCLSIFSHKFRYFVENVGIIDGLFEMSFSPLTSTGKSLSRCGLCNKYLYLVSSKPIRMFCKHCDHVYKMPQSGQMKEYKTLRCPLDNFELVFVANKLGKSYPLCPMCYDQPPFGARNAAGKYWELEHPIYQKYRPAVMHCIADQCSGTLCLDVDSAPDWQLDCNVCPQQLQIFHNKAHKVKVCASTYCEDCGAILLDVTLLKTKAFQDGTQQRSACIACDEEFNQEALSAQSRVFFRRSGGGKGKKGKGKGKGKGKKGPSEEDKAEERGRLAARGKK